MLIEENMKFLVAQTKISPRKLNKEEGLICGELLCQTAAATASAASTATSTSAIATTTATATLGRFPRIFCRTNGIPNIPTSL